MSNMRRSRLKPITYSRCCQRPSSPRRLATLVLPLTAPTRGSANGCTRRPTASGSKHRVAVDQHQQVAAGVPRCPALSAAGLPALGCADHPYAGQAEPAHDVGGAVGGAVVDDDDLDPRVVAGAPATARSPRCWPPRCRRARSTDTGPRYASGRRLRAGPAATCTRAAAHLHDRRSHGERRAPRPRAARSSRRPATRRRVCASRSAWPRNRSPARGRRVAGGQAEPLGDGGEPVARRSAGSRTVRARPRSATGRRRRRAASRPRRRRRGRGVAAPTIASTPGRRQSSVSRSASTAR